MSRSETGKDHTGLQSKLSMNGMVSDLSHIKSHQRQSSMKVSSITCTDESFSGYVETSTDRDQYTASKRRSSMSPKSTNDFVKKAYMAQRTQELKAPSKALRQGLHLKQKI